jgi:hypothetical protein
MYPRHEYPHNKRYRHPSRSYRWLQSFFFLDSDSACCHQKIARWQARDPSQTGPVLASDILEDCNRSESSWASRHSRPLYLPLSELTQHFGLGVDAAFWIQSDPGSDSVGPHAVRQTPTSGPAAAAGRGPPFDSGRAISSWGAGGPAGPIKLGYAASGRSAARLVSTRTGERGRPTRRWPTYPP